MVFCWPWTVEYSTLVLSPTVSAPIRGTEAEVHKPAAPVGRGTETEASKARDHLGLTIMRHLVEQLEGRLSLRNDGGTVVEVEFIPKGTKRE